MAVCGNAAGSIASATSASARPVTPPPHGLSPGCAAAALIQTSLGASAGRLEIAGVGPVVLHGPMVEALQGSLRDLTKAGLAGTMRRVGFQQHDGRIFEALVARGGILVAVHSEPRAADALAVMFSYGGGNAAIGAWTGRV